MAAPKKERERERERELISELELNTQYPVLVSRNLVLFPHTKSAIEIGRECSVSAIRCSERCFKNKIIIVAQKEFEVDFPMPADLYRIGTIANIKSIKEHKDGSLTVVLEGLHRVKLFNAHLSRHPGQEELGKMWVSNFEFLKEKNSSIVKNKASIDELFKFCEELFSLKGEDYEKVKKLAIVDEKGGEEKDLENCTLLIDRLCGLWPLSERDGVEIKQKWLEELNVSKRISLMLDYDYLSEIEREHINSSITRKVNKNISRQQREFYLRERIKVIREELGEGITKDSELKKFREWLKGEHAPSNIKERVAEELKKMEYTNSMSSNESLVLHNYVSWLISLPWFKSSKDQSNIQKVRKELDKKHCGLEKVKDRIIEFVAVQKKTKKAQGTIICLVGPPGVGKTSLAQSIARGLNKVCVKISLGGMSDEAEIRGHRKTYVGAMPGKIVKGLKQAQVNNPVFLLDEIDKVAAGHHGDPVSALLEVLDPNQNSKFLDNYIEEEIDLSKIMFIATANYEDNIPEPLLDRLEIIRLTSYTEKEKMFIAKTSLISEVLEEHGLKDSELTFSDKAVEYIIQRYTREAGVRGLKQCLSQIARKFVQKQETDKNLKSEKISEEKVREYLSTEKYEYTVKDEISIPGVVNGMAYTEYGGDLLPVEINFYSGKGNLLLTGNLKDTMKESANVALSYIRANEEEFKLSDTEWSNLDINLHVPAGGVPKDGPSAGITITTAMLSAFLKVPIPSNVAMTGEITLRGKVLPIGGLKEKIISAVRGGVDTIFFPKESERYLEDVPSDILDKIHLKPIRHYSELYNELFANRS
ncbi:endopeptidase La [Candidatus Mycoplasma haematominutum]|uniref:Lon protease n=1 Tax=Candidatus Mycoplasma haematominutum 'Birmingham 1' TaxID=1116213 RepID=G8C310_9MOLU|nr:endopeptidase La [Candidatus Mycoplasma haematominutum]CCE66708.1 ATP-dependent protease La [Candidatus Mycoplasma haematominutum 'Birmingham 1']